MYIAISHYHDNIKLHHVFEMEVQTLLMIVILFTIVNSYAEAADSGESLFLSKLTIDQFLTASASLICKN